MNDVDKKVLENLLRRHVKRRGLEIVKCKARDKKAIGFGLFKIVGEGYNQTTFSMTLDDLMKEIKPAKCSRHKTVLDLIGE